MSDKPPSFVKPLMRAGYAARGVTYVIVGVLAFLAAWKGGQAEGTKGALAQLREQPWGVWALALIAIGFFAYSIWRFACAWYDLEDRGTDAKAIVARIAQTVTAIIHLGLGAGTLRMAFGSGGGAGENGDGSAPESLTSKLLALPEGRYIVMAIGGLVVCAGIYYGYKGFAEKYKSHLRCTATTERLDPAIKAGLVAHGIVIGLIGVFLFYAGLNSNPGQAGGVGQAFETVRSMAFGRILLALLGLGVVGFAVYCFVEAIYRVIPRLADDSVTTLATRAKQKAKAEAARATPA